VPKTPIEDIVAYLTEVGDPLLHKRDKLNAARANIARLKAELADAEGWLAKDRETLLADVRKHYVDSEIETAEVLCNRHRTVSSA